MKMLICNLLLLVSIFLSSCGGDSISNPKECGGDSNSNPKEYGIQIALDQSDTTLQLVEFDMNGGPAPATEILMTVSLGYGSVDYLINQGSVPDWQSNVPPGCANRTDLGENDIGPCVVSPLLDLLAPTLATYGISISNLPTTVSFNTGASDAYSSWIIESAGKALDTYLDSLGYEGAAGLDGHSHPAYTHKDWTGRYRADWLADFQDSVPLSKISMPGTHDTMSFYGGDAVQTQSMSLRTQLMSGIRALDIRCRHIENRFAIHHGFVYQNANFDDVLQATQEFLSKHPTETIIMRVKEEYNPTGNTRTFASTFKYYLDMYPGLFWAYNMNNNPQLKDIRGKIVLLQDFHTEGLEYMGIPYHMAEVQDEYHLRTNWDLYSKWEKIKAHLEKAAYGNPNLIHINFLSGSGGSFPYFVASGKSSPGDDAPLLATGRTSPGWKSWPDFPRINCFLKICTIAFKGTNLLTSDYLTRHRRIGIVMADFPGDELILRIILQNYPPFG